MATKRFKPPLRLLCVVGTLAHNTAFTASEMAQYVAFDRNDGRRLSTKARPTIQWMLKHKLLRPGDKRGTYYPTKKGWNTIEKACRR